MEDSIFSILFSAISLLFSLIAGISIWRYNNVTLRNNSRQEHNKIMLDINKILMENPDLWTVYDNHPVSAVQKDKERNDPLLLAKRDAFVYHYINFFDILYDFYHRQIKQNKNDKEDWNAWAEFMRHYFRGSTAARNIFKKSSTWYDQDFSTFIMDLISEIEEKEVDENGGNYEAK